MPDSLSQIDQANQSTFSKFKTLFPNNNPWPVLALLPILVLLSVTVVLGDFEKKENSKKIDSDEKQEKTEEKKPENPSEVKPKEVEKPPVAVKPETPKKVCSGTEDTRKRFHEDCSFTFRAVGNFSVLVVEFFGPNSTDREVLISPGSGLNLDCKYQFNNKTTVRTVMNGSEDKDIITFVQGCSTIPAPPNTYLTYEHLRMPTLKYFSQYLSAEAKKYSKTFSLNVTTSGFHQVSGLAPQGGTGLTSEVKTENNSTEYIHNFFQTQIKNKKINTSGYDLVVVLYFDDQQIAKDGSGNPIMVNGQFAYDHNDAFGNFYKIKDRVAYINVNENINDHSGNSSVNGTNFSSQWNVATLNNYIAHQVLHLFGAADLTDKVYSGVLPIMYYPHVPLSSETVSKITVGDKTATEIGWK